MEVCTVSWGDRVRVCGLAQRHAKMWPGGTPISTVTLSKSPTLSDPQVPHLWLRKNSECTLGLLLHRDWVSKPLRLPWLGMLRVPSRLFSKDKMGIGNTDVTRDILSRKELFLETGDESPASWERSDVCNHQRPGASLSLIWRQHLWSDDSFGRSS